MNEINKEWVQNVGLELADSSNCPLYACTQCPNGTIHCDECFAIFMEKHDAKVRAEAIDECIKFIREHSGMHFVDCDGYFGGECDLIFSVDDWIDDLEQLKEKKQ